MQPFNAYSLYDLGARLGWLASAFVPGVTLDAVRRYATGAIEALDKFAGEEMVVPLPLSKGAAHELMFAIFDHCVKVKSPGTSVISAEDAESFGVPLKKLHAALDLELPRAAVYFVTGTLAYETDALMDEADKMFLPSVRAKLPADTVREIRQAGRSIAFGLSTATGFHLMRALETIIVLYLPLMPEQPKMRNWGEYLRVMTKGAVDSNIVGAIDVVRDKYRNDLMHPDMILDAEEALELFDKIRLLIIMTVRDLVDRGAL